MQWGDLTFTSEALGDYLSGEDSSTKKVTNYLRAFFKYEDANLFAQPKKGLLDSRQATLNYLLNKFTSSPSTANFQELNAALQ